MKDSDIAKRAKWWQAMTDQELQLHAGELTAGEVRAIRAVLNSITFDGARSKSEYKRLDLCGQRFLDTGKP